MVILVLLASLAFLSGAVGRGPSSSMGVDRTFAYFKSHAAALAVSVERLDSAIRRIDSRDTSTILDARVALVKCRCDYKRIEFFMEYFFGNIATAYNMPDKYEVEEPDMEYQTPTGFQVMERLLFEKNIGEAKTGLIQQSEILVGTSAALRELLFHFTTTDEEIVRSVRLELIRITTLGITGYDAPLLKSGILESAAAIESVGSVLESYDEGHTAECDSVRACVARCNGFLRVHHDFDGFDRLAFLTSYAWPLGRHMRARLAELHLAEGAGGWDVGPTGGVVAYPNGTGSSSAVLVRLGKRLFFEKGLSGNRRVSCTTCHDPDRYFTDGLPKSIGFDGHSVVSRNAPSLLYAGFQSRQFWDGRDSSLEQQVCTVVGNPVEMGGRPRKIVQALSGDDGYRALFRAAFPGDSEADSVVSFKRVEAAIAAYIRSLHPFNSALDRYWRGDRLALDTTQKRGFNLFMGKAQCGTCHFPPLFNGLTPPLFNRSELEVLGVTAGDDLNRPVLDTDQGKYETFPIKFYRRAFKTPSLRNVAKTGPYMHNGAFGSLKRVIQFYDKGGGRGLGLAVEEQSLSDRALHLSAAEMDDLERFLEALTDPRPSGTRNLKNR